MSKPIPDELENLSENLKLILALAEPYLNRNGAGLDEDWQEFIAVVQTTEIEARKSFAKLLSKREENTAKAYGGCTDCYGKGYATVNDRWSGHGTDGDIGGFEGHISGGNPNAMKFCKCDRGKQLAQFLSKREIEVRKEERSLAMMYLHDTNRLEDYKKRLTQLT